MSGYRMRRWCRPGQDRLYVDHEDGHRIGWVDLQTGAATAPDAAAAREIELAAFTYCHQHDVNRPWLPERPLLTLDSMRAPRAELRLPAPTSASWASAEPAALAVRPPWTDVPAGRAPRDDDPWNDLALNGAGEGARAEAERQRASSRRGRRFGAWLDRLQDRKTDERAWRVGAGGEELVGARLNRLTEHGWHVLHSIVIDDRWDIDHLVVGPGGVFTLNTKTHPRASVWVGDRAVMVNGYRTDYLRKARRESAQASRFLSEALGSLVPVLPGLVFVTAKLTVGSTTRAMPDVLVMGSREVPKVFTRRPHVLSGDQVETVFAHARRSTTWRSARRLVPDE